MKIGIDFDNTLVCYDQAYKALAAREGVMVPEASNAREVLKDIIMALPQGNVRWTQLQGELYGFFIKEAEPFPDAKTFLKKLKTQNVPFCIISHKSYYSAFGKIYSFREAALSWLQENGFFEEDTIGLNKEDCFWEHSQEDKINRITQEKCTHFIDDLPGVLSHNDFPEGVSRILFSPNTPVVIDGPFHQLKSWKEIESYLEKKPKQDILKPSIEIEYEILSEDEMRLKFEALIKRSFDSELVLCERIYQGGNNQGYRIKDSFGRTFFGKRYYRCAQDRRNRLEHEYSFLEVLKKNPHLPCAKALLRDDVHGLALYTFVKGRMPQEPLAHHWEQCLSFIESIQVFHSSEKAKSLPQASEAAWSLSQHLAFLQRRRDHWLFMAMNSMLDEQLQALVYEELEPLYQSQAAYLLGQEGFNVLWPREAALLSPSDFGLHNTLEDSEGNLSFIDFEYAGWDDPAKLIADFFSQIAFPAPESFYELFVERVTKIIPEAYHTLFQERLPKIEQCIRLKWCYILLNPLSPQYRNKHAFVRRPCNREIQIEKVKSAIRRCKSTNIAYV